MSGLVGIQWVLADLDRDRWDLLRGGERLASIELSLDGELDFGQEYIMDVVQGHDGHAMVPPFGGYAVTASGAMAIIEHWLGIEPAEVAVDG